MNSKEKRRQKEEIYEGVLNFGSFFPLNEKNLDEVERWRGLELSIFIENREMESPNPLEFTQEDQKNWAEKVLTVEERALFVSEKHWKFYKHYWVGKVENPLGIFSISLSASSYSCLPVWSLYILPEYRKRGIAEQVLGVLQDAALLFGFQGIRLTSDWTWQVPVRFYLKKKFWLHNWKHDLVFVKMKDMPKHRIVKQKEHLRFDLEEKRWWKPLLIAKRQEDDWLSWKETLFGLKIKDKNPTLFHLSQNTFALALAIQGWPLIRNEEMWAKRKNHSDCGEVEGLAHKIPIFEAISHNDGFSSFQAPRIPRLEYPNYNENQV